MPANPMNTTLRSGFLVLASLALSAPASAGPFENGLAAYNRGDFAAAQQIWRPLAQTGDPWAQKLPGVMYFNGDGMPQDGAGAIAWWRKAAELGAADAQFNLGLLYDEGRVLAQDDSQAAMWYRKAAEQGNAAAQYKLGLMYTEGRGVQRDNVLAHMLFNLAAMQGHADAQKDWDIAASFLTRDQIAEARRLASGWMEQRKRYADAQLESDAAGERHFLPMSGARTSGLVPKPVKTIRIGGDGRPKPE